MDIKRLILFVIFSFSILMLWDTWQKKHDPIVAPVASTQGAVQDASIPNANSVAVVGSTPSNSVPNTGAAFKLDSAQRINVSTDLFQAEIDTLGGDLRRLTLNKHRASDSQDSFVLLDDAAKPMLYVAQTGLIGKDLPNHKSLFTTQAISYSMPATADTQEVRLSWVGTGANAGLNVDKIYTFHRNSYVIDVTYQISNGSATAITPSVYYQILHDNQSNQGSKMMPTFTGGAYYTDADKYNKISFSDMEKKKFSKTANDGWVGLVQHYFAGAWIPKAGVSREYYTDKLSDTIYSIGAIAPIGSVAAGSKAELTAKLFAGPQTHADLVVAAPGLEYTVDYGWLTVVAKPIFWLLTKIQAVVINWGVAIILLTVLIKAAFYPLSAASYKSMAKMRELAPRLQTLKEKYGDDRQKMQQAMMELYKTEKINPMGGCLPILVQVPVFISLYWVLLGSIELRHAPFFGWIHDLSAIDPFYILPVLMGATMIIQTKLNPKPTDPMQAKVMQIMPVVFSVFFFFFPAGLVLYWLVNNILSISQQWYINKTIHAESIAKKSGVTKVK